MSSLKRRKEVVAVYLTNQTSSSAVQLLGNILLPSRDEKVSKLRDVVSSAFSAELCGQSFVFVSLHGWAVSTVLEREIDATCLLFADQSIRIRATFTKHRVGVLLFPTDASAAAQAIGFVSLQKLTCSVADFRTQFEEQHPQTYAALLRGRLALLDANGWPLTRDQESTTALLHVLTDSCVRVRKLDVFESMERSSSIRPQYSYANQASYASTTSQDCFDIMISYVPSEADDEAIALRDELSKQGYSVFLDVDLVKPGVDWQDTLQDAIYKTSLFVPLVTPEYGRTEWTNREVKLADTCTPKKLILPVNFLPNWPPKCLAIQFATTQSIQWNSSKESDRREAGKKVAQQISEFYVAHMGIDESGVSGTENVDHNGQPESRVVSPSKPLIVISCHPSQSEKVKKIELLLRQGGDPPGITYDTWIASVESDLKETGYLDTLKREVNNAVAVIFVISQEYCDSSSCEEVTFYLEGRKPFVPVLVGNVTVSDEVSRLMGAETFLKFDQVTLQKSLLKRLEIIVDPEKARLHREKIKREKAELVPLRRKLEKALPKGRKVYISGSAGFHNDKSEPICKELGKHLAREKDIVLVTGGFKGVGETVGRSFLKERKEKGFPENVVHVQAERDDDDKSEQTWQNPDLTFQDVPYGKTLFFGNSVRQRERLTPKVIPLCVLIEGGSGASFEANQFLHNLHTVIPIKVTGGAAGGKFDSPRGLSIIPRGVKEVDWKTLEDASASPTAIAEAVTRIINSL